MHVEVLYFRGYHALHIGVTSPAAAKITSTTGHLRGFCPPLFSLLRIPDHFLKSKQNLTNIIKSANMKWPRCDGITTAIMLSLHSKSIQLLAVAIVQVEQYTGNKKPGVTAFRLSAANEMAKMGRLRQWAWLMLRTELLGCVACSWKRMAARGRNGRKNGVGRGKC